MEFLQGFSQCSWPGPACRVWWEAWAALGAWAAAVVAGVSAFAVFYLGRQANKLATSQASQAEAERFREAYVVLRLIGPDAFAMLPKADVAHHYVTEQVTEEQYVNDVRLRHAVAAQFKQVKLPNIESVLHRIHVLDPPCAGAAAHSVATLRILRHLSDAAAEDRGGVPDLREAIDRRNRAALALIRNEANLLVTSLQLLHDAQPVRAFPERV